MQSNIISRLEEYMKELNLNNNQLTLAAGLSTGLLGKARRNRKGLHSESIEKILIAFPEINPNYLLTGEGCKYRTPDKQNICSGSTKKTDSDPVEILKQIIREKDERIEQLNQEIGALNQKIQQLKDNTNRSE